MRRAPFHWNPANLLLPALTLLCTSLPVHAQDLVHLVQPGDNLYDLAQRYLDDPTQWPELQRLNRIAHPRRLMPGNRLVIPAAMARPEPATADVLHIAGQASVTSAGQPRSSPLIPGARVGEGDRIEVAEDGFVTLKLADGSVLRMAAGTQVRLRELRHAPASGQVQTGIQLERGRVDSTVNPLPSTRSRFEVRTPRAVGGVRGTTFGVAVGADGDFIGDVREGAIQVNTLTAQARSAGTLVQAGQGARAGTSISVSPLLAPPDLSGVPAVMEDASRLDVPLLSDAGASAWQVRVATDDAAERVVRNGTFQQPTARFAALDDGTYLLVVRAIDAQGIPGAEATRRLVVNALPMAPMLREPRQGSRVVAPDVELLCTEGAGVIGYRFQVARDASFKELVAQTPDLARCEHTVQGLAPGAYTWRVAAVARDAQGQRDQGPFSQPVGFEVVALPPAPASPSLRGEGSDTLGVSWSASPGGPWRHQIQLAHDAAFTHLLDDQQLNEPDYSRRMPPAGAYHVRVRQMDATGLAGAWSAPQRLEVFGRVTTLDAQPLTSSEGKPVRPGAH